MARAPRGKGTGDDDQAVAAILRTAGAVPGTASWGDAVTRRPVAPGQRYEETRRSARVWEVEALLEDAKPPQVRLRDARFRSVRRTVPVSVLTNLANYMPAETGEDGDG